LWVIPPGGAKVRKVRFSVRFLAVAGLLSVLMLTTFVYVSSDYARVQILRLQNYLSLKRVMFERDHLVSSAQELKSELKSARNLNARNEKREKEVRQRLDELASVIKTTPSLEELAESMIARKEKSRRKGVGGAERSCVDEDGKSCSWLDLGRAKVGDAAFSFLSREEATGAENELVESLDQFIDALKILPLNRPAEAEINSSFGYRKSPFGGGIKLHEGVDFDTDYGDPIYATGDGVVSDVGYDYTYGIKVDVVHSRKIQTRYAHLARAAVKPGTRVCRGQLIGIAGSTGRSTGPHLHYEVRVNGSAKNPRQFLELSRRLEKVLKKG